MKVSRGRISLYRLLNSEEKLSKHLLETELFSETSMFTFLENYKTIVIKPAFGPGEICVSSENNQFKIITKKHMPKFIDKKDLFQHLILNELTQKHYITQPGTFHSSFLQSPFQYFVTVHRNSPSAEWCDISKTEKNRSVLGKYVYMHFLKKMENLSILAAKTLGESFPECNTIVIEIAYDLKGRIWIQDAVLHFSKSKWSQFTALRLNHTLSSYLPNTELFSQVTFRNFLLKYNDVIIKPCNGQQGLGIVKITLDDQFTYEIHTGSKKFIKANIEEAYHYIEENFLTKKDYIVQQTLPLATINGCPIDVRVIIQKVDSSWHVTGKMVKVAGQGYFITNAAQKLVSLSDAIQSSNITNKSKEMLEAEMDDLCISAASQLEKNVAGISIIGFDIGITHQGHIWIIEGNYQPDLHMFYKLEDKEMYINILKAKSDARSPES